MKIKLCFRHYGQDDPIPLEYISQIPGISHIVSAVYGITVGDVWERDRIQKISRSCKEKGLNFSVVESIPIHEDIKLWRGDCEKYTYNFCENIRRVSEVGVDCVTYNFMPIFDWTRTQLDKAAPDGSTSLVMYKEQINALDPLRDDISLPGWNASYTKEEVRELIVAYKALGEEGLWRNLEKFLNRILPTAETCGVKMAIHPDDPPYSIFGIPRIITSERSFDRVLSISNSPSNALCVCTGSLGCSASNDVVQMADKYSRMGKIAFVHMRNVRNLPDGSFEESAHFSSCGSLDMASVANVLAKNKYDGYIRPDHGRMIWGESGKAGYGLYDRALGATYITGLFEACERYHENK